MILGRVLIMRCLRLGPDVRTFEDICLTAPRSLKWCNMMRSTPMRRVGNRWHSRGPPSSNKILSIPSRYQRCRQINLIHLVNVLTVSYHRNSIWWLCQPNLINFKRLTSWIEWCNLTSVSARHYHGCQPRRRLAVDPRLISDQHTFRIWLVDIQPWHLAIGEIY